MKVSLQLLAAAALAVPAGTALAESTYGHDSAGSAAVSAKADINISVKIPKLVILRVGSAGNDPDTATIQGAFNTIPGTSGATAPLGDGSIQPTGWNDAAPTMADATATGVTVRAWTNGSGATLSGQVLTDFTDTNMASKITVAESGTVNSGLAHPGGANLSFGGTSAIARNEVVGQTWTYGMLGADMVTFAAGTHNATLRYTATAP